MIRTSSAGTTSSAKIRLVAVLALSFVPSSLGAAPSAPCERESAQGPEAGLRCLDALLDTQPDRPDARRARALLFQSRGRYREAMEDWNAILQKSSADGFALAGRARAFLATGATDAAFKDLQAALRSDPQNVAALRVFASAASASGNDVIAEQAWLRILEVDARDAEACMALGEMRLHQGRHPESADLLAQAVAVAPDEPRAHWLLGMALMPFAPGAAIPLLERAAFLKPTEPRIWFDLGRARLADDQVRLAGQAFTQALRILPGEVRIHLELAKVYMELEENAAARVHLLDALALNPTEEERASIFFHVGLLHSREGEDNAAERAWETALAHSSHVGAAVNLGVRHRVRGDPDAAESYFRMALRFEPGQPIASLDLGALLLESGRAEEGRALLGAVVRSSMPGDELETAARAWLSAKPGPVLPAGVERRPR